MVNALASKERSPRAHEGWVCGKPGTSVLRKPSHQNTPLGLTALCNKTVTVTDPTHPFYGLTLPLVGVTVKKRLGRVAVVWLHPGIERVIPVAATNLTENNSRPSPCCLSYAGIQALLAVVASLVTNYQEDVHVQRSGTDTADDSAVATPVIQSEAAFASTATGTGPTTAPSSVDQLVASDTSTSTLRDPANCSGGAS
jgi:hypothetical protein